MKFSAPVISIVMGIIANSQVLACDLNAVVEIEIRGMAFAPQHIEVCAGQTIRWTNTESRNFVHSVTADPQKAKDPANVLLPVGATPFDSGPILPGESFEQVFSVEGNYIYFCKPHELMGMIGSIQVVSSESI